MIAAIERRTDVDALHFRYCRQNMERARSEHSKTETAKYHRRHPLEQFSGRAVLQLVATPTGARDNERT
jgi:hypothetical protein